MNDSRMGNSKACQAAMAQPVELVRAHPVEAALVMFGVGVGVGVLLSQALEAPLHRLTAGRWAEAEASTLQRMSKQVMDAVASALPGAISRHLPGVR